MGKASTKNIVWNGRIEMFAKDETRCNEKIATRYKISNNKNVQTTTKWEY